MTIGRVYQVWAVMLAALLALSSCVVVPAPLPAGPAPVTTVAPTQSPPPAPTISATAAPAAAGALTAQPWQWVSFTNPVEKFDVEKPESYLLTFNKDGTVSIKADCNKAGGTYATTADGALAIKVGPTTMAACPPPSRGEQFVKLLSSAARYFFRDGKLYIDLMADGGTFMLAPA